MKKRIRVGVDLGSKYMRILVTHLPENSNHPQIITGAVEPSDGIRQGRIVSFLDAKKSLQKLLQKTEKELGESITLVNVAITGEFIKNKIVTTKNTVSKASNEISDLDFEKAREEVRNTIPLNSPYHILNVSLAEVKVDGKKVKDQALNNVGNIIETTHIVHLVPKKILEEFVHLFEDLDVSVNEIILSQLVSYIPLTKRSERSVGVGVLDIGHDSTSFTYLENELPISMRTWMIGGSNITNDIALIMETKIDDAEEIKKNYREINPKKVTPIISARLEDIVEIVKNEILKVNKLGKIPGGIIVTGGGSKISDIEEMLRKGFNMSITNGNQIISEITKSILKDSSWATAYGLTYIFNYETENSTSHFKGFFSFLNKLLKRISP